MQDYRYLAAITAVSNALDSLPQARHKLPYSVIADWMEAHEIAVDEVLLVSGDEVRAIIADLLEQDPPELPHAA